MNKLISRRFFGNLIRPRDAIRILAGWLDLPAGSPAGTSSALEQHWSDRPSVGPEIFSVDKIFLVNEIFLVNKIF